MRLSSECNVLGAGISQGNLGKGSELPQIA
jgi:hypothetical protein